jgi:peptide/nickel transport system permease protein
MYRYIINRLVLVIPTLVGAAALVFALMRLIPGDICVVRLASGGGTFNQHAVEVCHAEVGLDQPIVIQFWQFVSGLFRFDFGMSMWSGKPVSEEILTRLPISLEVALLATVVAIVIAIPLGTISALKQNSWTDLVVRTVAIAGIATPSFWLGILVILIILDTTQAITGTPWMPPIDYVSLWDDPVRNLSMAIWPAITVGYRYSAVTMRMTRSAMLEVLREDYIRTARAKGLSSGSILLKHALRNAAIPVVAIAAVQLGFMLGGSIVIESVFALHGVGFLAWESIGKNDFPVVQAVVLVLALIYVGLTLVADLINAVLDPRLRIA